MNKVLLLSFLLALSFELTIKNITDPKCQSSGKTTFNITVETDENDNITDKDSSIPLFFYLNKTNDTKQYLVQCLIPIDTQEEPNGTRTDIEEKEEEEEEKEEEEEEKKEEEEEKEKEKEEEEEEKEEEEEEKEEEEEEKNNNIRLLESPYESKEGTCIIIDKIENNETVVIPKQTGLNFDFKKNEIKLNSCAQNKTAILLDIINIFISFRQLNNFNFARPQKKVTFNFLGLITHNLKKGHPIYMDVNLIKGGFPENKPSPAMCILKEDVDIKDGKPEQGQFECTILNVEGEDVTSFIFVDSPNIAGVPDNSILLNPQLTDNYIGRGKLNITEIPPQFNSTSINTSTCGTDGKFKITGTLNSELKNDSNFELPLAYPENLTASCSIKKHKENEAAEIECETNGESNGIIIIGQNTILDKNKDELLIISKIKNDNTKCANGKINSVLKKLEYPITFRQVSKFRYDPIVKKAYYNFYGLTPERLTSGKTIKMLVYVINNGVKTQKEANCTLNSDVDIRNNGYGQANFRCEVDSNDVSEGIEIISSDDVSGINDDLEEYQKNPNMTDQMINNTKNEDEGGVGKVIDYSLENNSIIFPPIFEIVDIDTKNCEKKGKIKIRAKFGLNITRKTKFEIPLSYPASSIKCTTPKVEAGEEVTIKCNVQKDFYNVKQILIEPKIIKKKHREILFIKKYNSGSKTITCSNFNQIKLESSSKKFNAEYTFLKGNNFTILSNKGITFKIFLYLIGPFINSIPINLIMIKKKNSQLRNLDGFDDEEDYESIINCISTENKEGNVIGGGQVEALQCTDNDAKVDNISDILSLEIESDEMSGITEYNSNPIETDQNEGILDIRPDYISLLSNTNLKGDNCEESGVFDINGILNKEVEGKDNTNIEFSNPAETGGLCKYNKTDAGKDINVECQSQDEIEEDYIIIERQYIGNNLLVNSSKTKNSVSCSIGSLSAKTDSAEAGPLGDNSTSTGTGTNRFYTTEKSSGGLSGGTITAIVLVSVFVLVAVGVLIAVLKNGIIFGSKSGELVNSVSVPQANSSSNII